MPGTVVNILKHIPRRARVLENSSVNYVEILVFGESFNLSIICSQSREEDGRERSFVWTTCVYLFVPLSLFLLR